MTSNSITPAATSNPAVQMLQTQTAAAQSTAGPATGDTNPDFNRFLTLLTAQLKYQDPMSPTDPTAFVAQLAQFSQVEQQTKTNSLLQQMTTAVSGSGLSQTAALIGKQVNAATTSIAVPASGRVAPLDLDVSQAALKNPRLSITDANGVTLRSIPVGTGRSNLTFDGLLPDGQRLAAGNYGIKLVGDDSTGKEQVAGIVSAHGKVTEVRSQPGGDYVLILDDGSTIEASKVTSLAN